MAIGAMIACEYRAKKITIARSTDSPNIENATRIRALAGF
jgi:hypothetical protein